MSKISIELPKTDFCGGETISGAVVVDVARRVRSRGVRLLCEGYETQGWATGIGGEGGMPTRKNLFRDELELTGEGALDAGTHRFTFEYTLPPKLPGDYESHRGEAAIRYQLTAYVDRPLWVDIRTTTGLTIYEPRDEEASAASAEGQKTCQFAADQHIDVEAVIDRNLLAPGDSAKVSIKVANKSDKPVRSIRVGVEACEHINVDGEEHTHSDIVHETAFDLQVEPGAEGSHEVEYTLGEIYATILASSTIRVMHNLVVTLDVPHATDAEVRIPIVVREKPGEPSKGHGL